MGNRGEASHQLENGRIPIPPFDLVTMSGVRPGRRPPWFFRVPLEPSQAEGRADLYWGVLSLHADGSADLRLYQKTDDQWDLDPAPLWTGTSVLPSLWDAVAAGCARAGWRLRTCGACGYYRALPGNELDELPQGRCTLGTAPAALAQSTPFALHCPHWQAQPANAANPPEPAPPESNPAEEAPVARPGRLQRWLGRLRPGNARAEKPDHRAGVAERSGVGAGASPCLCCHGKMANIGALTLTTPEGDERTLSLWRCRTCRTIFLNDWIDRWVRLDSLETREAYYRTSPPGAAHFLQLCRQMQDRAQEVEAETVLAQATSLIQKSIWVSLQVRHGR